MMNLGIERVKLEILPFTQRFSIICVGEPTPLSFALSRMLDLTDPARTHEMEVAANELIDALKNADFGAFMERLMGEEEG